MPLIERILDGVPASSAETVEGERVPTPPAAQAHADLEALIAYSLVSLIAPEGSSPSGITRMRLHPLVRELARQEWAHLPALEQEAALGGLLAGGRAWLARHQSLSISAVETPALDEDLVAGAVCEAVARHSELHQAMAVAEAWGDYLYVRNLPLDREMAGLQLECARWIGDRRAEVAALRHLAGPNGLEGQQDDATAYRQAALAIAREMGDQLEVLSLLSLLGSSVAFSGMRREAERMYEEASAIDREMGDRLTDGGALGLLGEFARAMGRFEEAERWYQRALASCRATGDIASEAVHEVNLGLLYEQMGDTAAAQRIYEDRLAWGRAYGHRLGIGLLLNALGQLALRAGDLEIAGPPASWPRRSLTWNRAVSRRWSCRYAAIWRSWWDWRRCAAVIGRQQRRRSRKRSASLTRTAHWRRVDRPPRTSGPSCANCWPGCESSRY